VKDLRSEIVSSNSLGDVGAKKGFGQPSRWRRPDLDSSSAGSVGCTEYSVPLDVDE